MKIGIKYCGGCNSRYDRTREVNKLKKRFPQHQFTYQIDEEIYDICLLVCGCQTACASPEGIAAKSFEQLCTPAQFSQFAAALENKSDSAQQLEKTSLHTGETASLKKIFTDGDIQTFASLTGHCGKLHNDASFAAQCGFKRPVLPSALLEGLISALIETQLPGDGAFLAEKTLRIAAPAYVGDAVTATAAVTCVTAQRDRYEAELHICCTNQADKLLAEGTYCCILPQTLFTYTE